MLSVPIIELETFVDYLQASYANLSNRQLQAVEIMAFGGDDNEIIKVLDVSRLTVWRWKKESSFKKAVATYSDLLSVYSRVNKINVAIELFEILRKRLQASELQFVINWLKQEANNLQDLYPSLNCKQIQAIKLIVKGESVVNIGEKIGVCRETISRWRNSELVFQQAIETYKERTQFSGSFTRYSNSIEVVELLQKQLQTSELAYTLNWLKLESVYSHLCKITRCS